MLLQSHRRIFVLAVLSCLLASGKAYAVELNASDLEFFERRIRPIFADHCYQCHSARSEKVKGGLLLDTREGLRKGGDSGPAIIADDPDRSLLIKAVRYTDDSLQMPPKNKKLSSEQISDLEAWVKLGAPDPRSSQLPAPTPRPSTQPHWAFQPVVKPVIPGVKNPKWIQTPVDALILAKLEANGLAPAPAADKRTLLRRVSYDLIGLPPTAQEVADFLADGSSGAFLRVVDRSLNSPHYGERWARHWLDVARYSDTKGYVFEEERRFPYSYTFRDYVIQAFNDDLPFDQFVVQQIAADRLPLGEDKRPLAALGYLTLGRRFLNNQHDIIDDRIDVVTRGFMGLTVACARCHDHKYDPIPTQDYYSLYGVFASSSEPREQPLLGVTPNAKAYQEYVAERKKREVELETFRATKEKDAFTQLRQQTADYLMAAHDAKRLGDSSRAEGLARERKLHPGTVQRWADRLESWSQQSHPIFAPWFTFEKLATNEFAAKARELTMQFVVGRGSTNPLNPFVIHAFAGEPPASMKDVAERYGKLFADVDKRWQDTAQAFQKPTGLEGAGNAPVPNGFADPNLEAIRQILYGPDSPANVPAAEVRRLFDVPTAQRVRALQRKVDELDATHPGAPPRAMALVDNSTPTNPRVFVRGNPNNRGEEVPRQFLAALANGKRQPFSDGSGRLELARAIASRDNPLTARVFVNRVWLHLFGAGLVRTPSDFGVRCEPPSHPELLDYLAWRFIEDGWSVKELTRLIVSSSVYQQSSVAAFVRTRLTSSTASDVFSRVLTNAATLDPENRLLARMNRRRMDLEAMRDSLLKVAGRLDLTAGGRGVDITAQPFSARRTVYGFVERQNLPGMFRTFDFANPDTTSPQRFSTTVPQQALYMLNSPFVTQQAQHFVSHPEFISQVSEEGRVKALYWLAYQRDPDPEEIEMAIQFVKAQDSLRSLSAEPIEQDSKEAPQPLKPWEKYAQVLLMSNELVFVD